MAETQTSEADIGLIQRIIPHRYPFLLIDKVRDIVPHKSGVGIKNVTFNEPHFQGHFPKQPVMPGVTIVEPMAQTAAVVVGVSLDLADRGMRTYFMAIDKVKFRRMVVPGDVLELHVQIKRIIRTMTFYTCVARVGGEEVASADVLCAETEKE